MVRGDSRVPRPKPSRGRCFDVLVEQEEASVLQQFRSSSVPWEESTVSADVVGDVEDGELGFPYPGLKRTRTCLLSSEFRGRS